jgi:hypothetical protein
MRDLYHRIASARVRIPPLRERGDDAQLRDRHCFFSSVVAGPAYGSGHNGIWRSVTRRPDDNVLVWSSRT